MTQRDSPITSETMRKLIRPSVLKCSNRQAEVEHQQLKIVLARWGTFLIPQQIPTRWAQKITSWWNNTSYPFMWPFLGVITPFIYNYIVGTHLGPDIQKILQSYRGSEERCEWNPEKTPSRSFRRCSELEKHRSSRSVFSNRTPTYLKGAYPRHPKKPPIQKEIPSWTVGWGSRVCSRGMLENS